ncbi:MAG TPA: hypothetical protein DCO75_09465 [Fibrobacteres bacterium]|nr:hypothetical protein [Fibrobacterota bacterium]
MTYTWSAGKNVLTISPAYSQASPYFHVMPQAGMFIPTDSIRLIVSSAITDTAKTPNGPNNLDIRCISARALLSDTIFSYRIDSITFDLVSVSPDSADVNAAPDAPITLIFSSPPLSGTIDTSKNNNRCLVVYSSYHDSSQISFSRITQNNNSVTFVPSKRFFYGDTVFCRYRSATIRDSLGYPVAINNNGIPVSLFDTSSSEGDKLWYFVIRDIPVKSVSPAANETNVPADKAITIIFFDTLPAGVLDTSGIGNRNIVVTSRCSNGAQIGFSSVAASGAMAVFTPSVKLYYGDSVNCSYRGLSTSDTSRYFVEKTVFAKDKTAWSFTIKNINMVSVQPESSMVSSSIHPEIVMHFSDPVYTGTFDADTSNSNRSFRLTSTFCKDTLLPFKSIKFSSDNRRIYIIPDASFFSNDSVYCTFAGFLKNITYNGNNNLPLATSEVKGSHGWYFFIQNAGFYTYPNPYKPGVDLRHCGSNGPCGIWFKNLHTLKAGVNEVSVKIFSITSHPLYSTRDAGVRIMFETGNTNSKPEWKWDTRNRHGELVASGLYLYAIYDVKDNVIKKGKLIIVR